MKTISAAIITIKNITLVAVLVDIESTYPAPGDAMIRRAQPYFPSLPILLISPRIDGFSRTFAAFELDQLVPHLNADLIAWIAHSLPVDDGELPF